MIRRVHFVKGPGIEDIVAQELVSSSVELIRAGSSNDVDLPAAGSAHLGGIASRLHFEFLHRVRGGTKVESVECGISVRRAVQQKVIRVGPGTANTDR